MQAEETGDRPGGERQQDSRPQLPHDRRPHAHSILLRSLHTAARQGCASDVPRGSGRGRKCSGADSAKAAGGRHEMGPDVRPFKIRCRHFSGLVLLGALERADIGSQPPRVHTTVASMSDPFSTIAHMKVDQEELPFRQWGGARKGSGRKRQSARPNVPYRPRQGFRKGALHVTLRMRREVWNLRTHRCFRAVRSAFAQGCERFGFRLVEFSVQRNQLDWTISRRSSAAGRAA